MRFYKKDIKKCAQDCHVYILADEKLFKQLTECDGAALRKYFTSWLMKAPDAPVAPQLQQVEEPKIETDPAKQPIPKDDPRYQEYLQMWLDSLKETTNAFKTQPITKREVAEEGGWTPKKEGNYVPMDPNLFYLKEGVTKFSGRKYKGMLTFPGFRHFDFGMVSVYADSKESAEEILTKAGRYAKAKVAKIKAVLVNERLT